MIHKYLKRRRDLSVSKRTGERIKCISTTYLLTCSQNNYSRELENFSLTEWKTGRSIALPVPFRDPQMFADTLIYDASSVVDSTYIHQINTIRDRKIIPWSRFKSSAENFTSFIWCPLIGRVIWISGPNMYICDSAGPIMIKNDRKLIGVTDTFANTQILLIEYEDMVDVLHPKNLIDREHLCESGFAHAPIFPDVSIIALNPIHNQCIIATEHRNVIWDIEQTSSPARRLPMQPIHNRYLDSNLIIGVRVWDTLIWTDTRVMLPAYDMHLPQCNIPKVSAYDGSTTITCGIEYEGGIAILD